MSFTREANGIALATRLFGGPNSDWRGTAHWHVFMAMSTLLLAAPAFAVAGWVFTPTNPAVLFYALPIVVAELLVITLAIIAGFDLRATILRLHPITRVGAGVWLAVVLFANLVAAPVPAAALPLLFTTLVHATFAIALWSLVTTRWAPRQKNFLCCAAAGAGLFGVVFTAIVLAELDNPAFDWVGVGIGITNIRQLGFYGVTLSGIALGFGGSARGWHWILAAIGATLGFWLTILSGSRIALAAGILAAIIIGVLSKSEWRRSLAGLVTLALAVAIPASYLLVPHEAWGFDRIIDRSFSDNSEDYTSGRLTIWMETSSAILQNPLLGHGEGQFRSQIEAAGNGLNHPHNALLQFLYQWGLAGTLALAAMLSATARRLRSALAEGRSDTELAAVGALVGLLSTAMLEGALYHVYPVMIVVLCMAILNAAASTKLSAPAPTRMATQSARVALGK